MTARLSLTSAHKFHTAKLQIFDRQQTHNTHTNTDTLIHTHRRTLHCDRPTRKFVCVKGFSAQSAILAELGYLKREVTLPQTRQLC